jgi:hypothetical protein
MQTNGGTLIDLIIRPSPRIRSVAAVGLMGQDPNIAAPARQNRKHRWRPVILRRFDGAHVQDHTSLAAKKIEQYGNSLLATHAFEQAKGVSEGAFPYTNLVT